MVCEYSDYMVNFLNATLNEFGTDGTLSGLNCNGSLRCPCVGFAASGVAALYATSVTNSLGEVWSGVGGGLTKRTSSGALIWSNCVSGLWSVAADQFGGAHIADQTPALMRYDYDGNLVWTLHLPSECISMVLDAQGNRFLSMASGALARLGAETLSASVITNAPQGQTVLAGTNVTFAVGATGSGPLRYFWLSNGAPLLSGTNTTVTLSNVTPAQTGSYSVIVSNFVGSVTSAPVLLRVKQVELYWGNQLLTNGTYTFATPPTLSVRSTFASGSSFYTLDGSA